MKRILWTAVALLALVTAARAQAAAPDAAELNRLLNEFLAGAGRNDAATHERFWADDLVYTGSTGRRVGKADIMRDVRNAPPPKPTDPAITYGAEDVRIQQYGDTAVVAFRLVATTAREGKTEVSRYFNTGTFLKRGGRWQVVSWQATRVPRAEEEVRTEVAAVEAAFRQALTAGDVKALEALTADGFVWKRCAGAQLTRQQLLEHLGAGLLKFPKATAVAVNVNLHGDAAVVHGVNAKEGDAPPFHFTVTLVNRGGWKALSLLTTTP